MEGERERERNAYIYIDIYVCIYIYIYIGDYKQTNISLRASESFVGGDPTFGQIFGANLMGSPCFH